VNQYILGEEEESDDEVVFLFASCDHACATTTSEREAVGEYRVSTR
jgi:hypothetical protein